MSLIDTFLHHLAERRQRRRRYAETLEILSLPPEIQRDIIRREDESDMPAARSERRREARRDIAA
ncbi:hypothetical protein GRZ55_18800 [Chelativorans sp. ZYF759]|uniref:hypothetical protein n=1 Tax=Chelativorans sp. ZYF759 TaxID=2692213 RepID=UPI00145C4897|nr:hypothetical protein [Chelativorans sp. ZYF759]NMG41297.1 hypothetical protein [Chelativorans sp. ZYF759]